jgi:DNA (cytosine-5)-methyltransferase 1
MTKKKRAIKAIDLFAGVGGSSRGAIAAGARIALAVDHWDLARKTYQSNFPGVIFLNASCEDIGLARLKKRVRGIDLILASPECTSHTCAKGNAPRSEASRRTAFQVIRFAKAFGPRWVIIENVVHMRTWKSYEKWLNSLRDLGYNVTEQVINSADHGVPQARRRLFVMCDRKRVPPKVEASAKRKKTAAFVIKQNAGFKFSMLRSDNRAKATLKRAERAVAALGARKAFLLVYYGSDAAGGWQRLTAPLRTLTTLDRFAYVRPTPNGHKMRMLQVPELKKAMGFPERCFQAPRQNGPFWSEKIAKNRRRDRKVASCLRAEGVRVIRVWEHELEKRSYRLLRVLQELRRMECECRVAKSLCSRPQKH